MLLFLNVIYVLIAAAMIVMILMQRGAGAQAGAGFGGGASATVFGARGASSFLSKSTKWLAISFFTIAMFMAWHATRTAGPVVAGQDLGVMAQMPAETGAGVPVLPGQATVEPAPPAAASEVPSAPAAVEPTESAPSEPIQN